jgi:O-antigen ligase
MLIVVAGILASAASILQARGIGTFDPFDRATGLSGGANTAARYFVYGIVFLSFLQSNRRMNPIWRFIQILSIGILILAILYTGSRSGALILGLALTLLARRFLIGKQRSLMLWLVVVIGIVWFAKEMQETVFEPTRIINSIVFGEDTVGTRYDLWKAGWLMWQDHPVSGVGIGQFGNYLLAYWSGSSSPRVSTTHNTYIQILVETGLVGFLLFGLMTLTALRSLWQRAHARNSLYANVNWAWLIVLLVLLFGAISKTDLTDKLFWLLLGISENELSS